MMLNRYSLSAVALIPVLVLASCQSAAQSDKASQEIVEVTVPKPRPTKSAAEPGPDIIPVALPGNEIAGEAQIMDMWKSFDRRDQCAPIGFLRSDMDGEISTWPAKDIWKIQFEYPAMGRIYYLEAMRMLLPSNVDEAGRRAAMKERLPYFIELPGLAPGAYAGYGRQGMDESYTADNPEGRNAVSVAIIQIPGQNCSYHVTSSISRAFHESLLKRLRVIAVK